MSKDSSAKYCQDNKERFQKIACETYESLSKQKSEKSNKIIVNNTKIYLKMKF